MAEAERGSDCYIEIFAAPAVDLRPALVAGFCVSALSRRFDLLQPATPACSRTIAAPLDWVNGRPRFKAGAAFLYDPFTRAVPLSAPDVFLDVAADVRADIRADVGPDVMGDETRWVTYDELATALGIAPDSARRLVARKRWPRQ